MKFGTSLMGVRMRDYAEVASCFEEAGFESIWVPEHLAFPTEMPATYPYSDDGLPMVNTKTPCYDPWVVLAYVACATTTIRLATNVYILPLRHPLQTAPDEIIRILRRLWSEEAIEDHSDYYDFGPLHFEPKPLQKPSIPIEVGGTSRAALQRAGTLGDGWIEVGARDAGATRVIAMPWRGGSAVSPAEAREWADRYADEVING